MTEMMSLSEVLPGAFPPGGEQPGRRRGAARQQRKRKKKARRRTFVILLLTIVIVGGALAGAYVLAIGPMITRLNEPKDYVGAGTGEITVKVPDGATGRAIAALLAKDDVVKTEVAFTDAARKDARSTSVQPGTYTMKKQMSGAAALAALLDPGSRLTLSVTIPEGTRAKDTLVLIQKKLKLSKSAVDRAAKSDDIGLPKAAGGKLEGYLFPATYDFQPDVTATEVLTKMVATGQGIFDSLEIPPAQLRTVVIKASIIQAEVGDVKYMARVSRVLDNRLKINMPLGLDTTVSYATQKFNVTTTKADRQSKSPYNTYTHVGLPPRPISNPGEEALKAAMQPASGSWLYFVTTNPSTGETKFAVDKAGHDANAEEFYAWLRAHPQSK